MILSTALVLDSLKQVASKEAANARASGSDYIRKYLLKNGWKGDNIYTTATLLRAIGNLEGFPYEMVLSGIEYLSEQRNADRGWGEQHGETSSMEATSRCLFALCTAGENRLTSSRLSMAALDDAMGQVKKLKSDMEQLRSDMRANVAKEARNIVDKNDQLTRKVTELEEEKRTILQQLREAQRRIADLENEVSRRDYAYRGAESLRETFELAPRVSSLLRFPLGRLIVYVAVFGGAAALALLPRLMPTISPWLKVACEVVAAGVAGVGGLQVYNLFFRSRYYGLQGTDVLRLGVTDSEVFLRQLSDLLLSWPPSKGEEFLYRFRSEIRNMPVEERELYSRYLADQFAQNEQERQKLRVLITLFLTLPENEQMFALSRLRDRGFRSGPAPFK